MMMTVMISMRMFRTFARVRHRDKSEWSRALNYVEKI